VAEIKAGTFREDLYYRLKVFPLTVPPLRERASDIPLLIEDFVDQLVKRGGCKRARFSLQTLELLATYPWPGNVRELKNFVERMLIIMNGRDVTPDRLPPEVLSQCRVPATDGEAPAPRAAATASNAAPVASPGTNDSAPLAASVVSDDDDDLADGLANGLMPDSFPAGPLDLKEARAAFEAKFLEAKLREFSGNVSKLAEAVGLDRSSLYRKLKGYGLMAE
jgi:two-component system, NtrC family, nitrogen regulation response regulator NtrX